MKTAVIFDLGNTLVSYYTREDWPAIQDACIGGVADDLRSRGLLRIGTADLPRRVEAVTHERKDHRVVPLADRIAQVFALSAEEHAGGEAMELCRCFMAPVFATARRYDDALPTLAALRQAGVRTGILSNTPWGSPAELWREELRRHGLLNAVDEVAFCVEAGWRKPARQPFDLIMARLGVSPEQCLFVGDDPRWDIAGPRAIGMEAILIDRSRPAKSPEPGVITGLAELLVQ